MPRPRQDSQRATLGGRALLYIVLSHPRARGGWDSGGGKSSAPGRPPLVLTGPGWPVTGLLAGAAPMDWAPASGSGSGPSSQSLPAPFTLRHPPTPSRPPRSTRAGTIAPEWLGRPYFLSSVALIVALGRPVRGAPALDSQTHPILRVATQSASSTSVSLPVRRAILLPL